MAEEGPMTPQQARDLEAAVAAAAAALEARHPVASRPAWFNACVFQSTRRSADDKVEVRYAAERKLPLERNYTWEDSPTGPRLIKIDEATGRRTVVITRDTGEFIDLFTAVFDPCTGAIEIVTDTIGATSPEELEHPR